MLPSRALVILGRHGHRAPAINIHQHHQQHNHQHPHSYTHHQRAKDETLLWDALMPSEHTIHTLDSKYPVFNSQHNPTPRDVSTKPFGCMTMRGVSHMKSVGERIAQEFPFVAYADDLTVYATNYRRTQLSAQAMLDGMGVGMNTGKAVSIGVRPMNLCSMSCYEGKAALLKPSLTAVQNKHIFQNTSRSYLHLRESLCKEYPAFEEHFNWVHALDFFVCRKSHSIKIPMHLQGLEAHVREHLCWRYDQYYKDPLHLALVAGPLLHDIVTSIQQSLNKSSGAVRSQTHAHPQMPPAVSIYLGHDVNVMAMAYALGIIPTLHTQTRMHTWWPPYGCTLILDAHAEPGEIAKVKITVYGSAEHTCTWSLELSLQELLHRRDELRSCANAHPLVQQLGSEMQFGW